MRTVADLAAIEQVKFPHLERLRLSTIVDDELAVAQALLRIWWFSSLKEASIMFREHDARELLRKSQGWDGRFVSNAPRFVIETEDQ